ncbi:DMT family transporter [Pedobacter nutrimenti]|jgi:small multidrug resistance pump|uniref:Small multidrug resistance pump n=1 Tax=Pedobacter nutrimenti TaxID=1241337 RepID=A0A318UTB6_9SPHI|nr:SMR family transporter [Pedobacter nutrimenti]PYF74869.1 small multidrug resistance pump [Pedobacter nutrimenti]|eukprot:gene11753-13713_t
MKNYLFLALAIVFEVIATTSLKASGQFTKFWPSVAVVIGYLISFYCLSITLTKLPLGISYAIWSGLGIVLVSILGLLVYKQKLDLPAILGIALILIGVLVINLFSKTSVH